MKFDKNLDQNLSGDVESGEEESMSDDQYRSPNKR